MSHIPADLICQCGQPCKVYREAGTAWIGCQQCRLEIHCEEPTDFAQAARALKEYWEQNGQVAIIDVIQPKRRER
jgi:hypothetical protein